MKLISDVVTVNIKREGDVDGYVGAIFMAGLSVMVVAADLEIVKELSLDAARLLWLRCGSAVLPDSLVEPVWEGVLEAPLQRVN